MKRLFRKHAKQPGLPPGSLVFTGEARTEPVTLSLISYDENIIEEKPDATIEECTDLVDRTTVTWVNVNGVHDVQAIETLGTLVDLHPLILEDLVHLGQRPKLEEYDDYLFIVLKMLHYDEHNNLEIEQVSLVVGKRYVMSFQEFAGDVFEPVRQRLRNGKGRLRKMSADYLAYALIDTVIDHYFTVIEHIGERIEQLEEQLLDDPAKELLVSINKLKREVIQLRKSIWPLREVVGGLQRSESPILNKKTLVFLRDAYDHTIQVVEMIETYRDFLSSLTDLYMSSLSHKMNEIMQFLTIIGAIFIPLTFIAGVYGMNFDRMPELHWPYGYPMIMALMVFLGLGLVFYFKRKKWL